MKSCCSPAMPLLLKVDGNVCHCLATSSPSSPGGDRQRLKTAWWHCLVAEARWQNRNRNDRKCIFCKHFNTSAVESAWSCYIVKAILLVSLLVISALAFNICGKQKAKVSQPSGEGQTTSLRLCSCNLHKKKELLHLSGRFYH